MWSWCSSILYLPFLVFIFIINSVPCNFFVLWLVKFECFTFVNCNTNRLASGPTQIPATYYIWIFMSKNGIVYIIKY
jgi:hypothetical protein